MRVLQSLWTFRLRDEFRRVLGDPGPPPVDAGLALIARSGWTAIAEVGVAALVQYRHDQKTITEDSVTNRVREAVGWNLALDDLAVGIAKYRLAGVGPLRRPDGGCVDRIEEAGTEPALLILVPVPGVQEVEIDKFVIFDPKAHASRCARRSANRC